MRYHVSEQTKLLIFRNVFPRLQLVPRAGKVLGTN